MKQLAALFSALAFGAFYTSCGDQYSSGSTGIIWGVLFALMSVIFSALARARSTAIRTALANDLVQKVLRGEQALYYLYLRPFNITNRVPVTHPDKTLVQDSFHPDRRRDFETNVTEALEKAGIPLIALGRPGEADGAGRYAADETHWKEIFGALAASSAGIIMVPSITSGTIYEATWIVSNSAVAKTVFIRLPNIGMSDWVEISNVFRGVGLCLPDIRIEATVLIKLADSGSEGVYFPLKTTARTDFGHLIIDLRGRDIIEETNNS